MTEHNAPVTLGEAADMMNGRVLRGRSDLPLGPVTTDSRSVPPRSLFFALKGERCDAHSFVAAAATAGAAAAVVDRAVPTPLDFGLVQVPDTTRALGDFAAAWRRRFRPRVAAVTGTSGKTTTKNFLASICRIRHRTLATGGNLNNHIGVPLTLFGLDANIERAIIEMGMSDRGEIARLAEIAAPQVGVITSIGPAHLDRLGSVDGVLDAKAELITYLNAHQGTVVLNADAPEFERLAARVTCRLVSVGESENATVRIRDVETRGYQPAIFTLFGVPVRLRQSGRHAVANAALAGVTAELLGIDRLDIIAGLAECEPVGGRGQVLDFDGVRLVDDAYNANPLSYAAALAMLASEPANRRLVVLGDMLELGGDAVEHHERLGRLMAERGVDIILHRGELAAVTARAAGVRQVACATNEELVAQLDRLLLPGDVVLVKASHGMRLDEVVAGIVARRRARRPADVIPLKR